MKRGKDWKYENQDHYNSLPGTGIIADCDPYMWAEVHWKNGYKESYRIGVENSYDLHYTGNNKFPKTQ